MSLSAIQLQSGSQPDRAGNWLTVDQAAELERITPRAVRLRVERQACAVQWIESERGQRQMLVPLEALTPDAQARWLAGQYATRGHDSESCPQDLVFRLRGERAWQATTAEVANDPRAARTFSRNAQLVQRAIAARDEAKRDGRPVTETMKRFAKANNSSLGTLYKKIRAYEDEGPAALVDMRGRRRGCRLPEWQTDLVKANYLQGARPGEPRFSVQQVWELLDEECEARDERTPSPTAVKRYIRDEIPERVKVFHREGKKAWKDRYEPVMRRSTADLDYNEICSLDSRLIDMFVYPGAERGVGAPIRPTLVIVRDIASRRIMGWALGRKSNSSLIALATREHIHTDGIPGYYQIDNGNDYTSMHLSGGKRWSRPRPDDACKGVWGMLGIDTRPAIPFNARSKTAENWFSVMAARFERQYPGWAGKDTVVKPEKLAAEIKQGLLLTWPEAVAAFEEFVHWYNEKHVVECSEMNCTPNAKALELKALGDAPRFPTDRALDLMLLKSGQAGHKVHNRGIKVFGQWYWADELTRHMGDSLTVLHDPRDMAEIQVYDMDAGEFVCSARLNANLASWNPTESEMRAGARDKKAAIEAVRDYDRTVELAYNPTAAVRERIAKDGVQPTDTAGAGGAQPHGAQPPSAGEDASQSEATVPPRVVAVTDLDRIPEGHTAPADRRGSENSIQPDQPHSSDPRASAPVDETLPTGPAAMRSYYANRGKERAAKQTGTE